MKKLVFACMVLLAGGTAKAQYPYCTTPTSLPFFLVYGECVGDGNRGDFPYGDVNANFQSGQCNGGSCGQCLYGFVVSSGGICDFPPCYGYWNDLWVITYFEVMNVDTTNIIVGCTWNPYGKLIKPQKNPPIDAKVPELRPWRRRSIS